MNTNIIWRYNMQFDIWEIGYYQGSRFVIIDFVKD